MKQSQIVDLAKALDTTPSCLMGWDIDVNNSTTVCSDNRTINANSGTNNNPATHTTHNYYSVPCEKYIVNHNIDATINSKEYFFRLMLHTKDISDEQLLDMIKYAEFILNQK